MSHLLNASNELLDPGTRPNEGAGSVPRDEGFMMKSTSWLGRVVPMIATLGLGFGLSAVAACGGDDGSSVASGTGGASCVPNQQSECACPDGSMSVQLCNASGTFDACMCDAGTGTDGSDSNGSSDDGIDSAEGEGGTSGSVCGDGIEQDGECIPESPAHCPEDCDGAEGSGGSTGADACAQMPTYFGMVPNIPSQWSDQGLMGFAAGNSLCQGIGADHVCDYEELLDAEAAGEFATIAAGTTAWIHRTTMAMVDGVLSSPGPGGRCVDWTYGTNHISDGEYVEFSTGGTPTYHLDADTFYDGQDTTHTIPDELQCGNANRAILCCNPACEE